MTSPLFDMLELELDKGLEIMGTRVVPAALASTGAAVTEAPEMIAPESTPLSVATGSAPIIEVFAI